MGENITSFQPNPVSARKRFERYVPLPPFYFAGLMTPYYYTGQYSRYSGPWFPPETYLIKAGWISARAAGFIFAGYPSVTKVNLVSKNPFNQERVLGSLSMSYSATTASIEAVGDFRDPPIVSSLETVSMYIVDGAGHSDVTVQWYAERL